MTTGMVNVHQEAILRLTVRGPDGREEDIDAIIDTGFSGSLTLPSAVIADLGLPWRSRGLVLVANGAEEQCDIYAATLIWDGTPRHILVEAPETAPLLGMAVLSGSRMCLDVAAGGAVSIDALP